MTDQSKAEMKLISSRRDSPDIFGVESKLFTLLKKAATIKGEESDSNAGSAAGTKPHLIDKLAARELRDFNATHAICIDAKIASTLGLGHRERSIHEILNPLCRFSWQDTMNALAEDYWETGECFLEAVFGDATNRQLVTGLYHIESAQIQVEVEEQNRSKKFHYVVQGEADAGNTLVMAKWGDLEDLKARFGQQDAEEVEPSEEGEGAEGDGLTITLEELMAPANQAPVNLNGGSALNGNIVNSEVIHIRQATNKSPYNGYPDYMSAVPSIELVQCMTQHEFDFYFNRGVPEFMLFLLGKNLGKCWEKVEKMIQANQGLTNSHKTAAIHIPGIASETKVQVEKLAMEDAGNSGFSEKSGTLDMRIATAHGMPPQLANIALPGKIGGANEGPNAMLTFQMRKLGQAQKLFSDMFACSLGADGILFNQPTGSPKAISKDLFLATSAKTVDDNGSPQFIQPGNGFNTILDGMTLGAAETLNKMAEPLAGSGRDISQGTLDGARDRGDQDPRQRPSNA